MELGRVVRTGGGCVHFLQGREGMLWRWLQVYTHVIALHVYYERIVMTALFFSKTRSAYRKLLLGYCKKNCVSICTNVDIETEILIGSQTSSPPPPSGGGVGGGGGFWTGAATGGALGYLFGNRGGGG